MKKTTRTHIGNISRDGSILTDAQLKLVSGGAPPGDGTPQPTGYWRLSTSTTPQGTPDTAQDYIRD